MNRRRFLSLLGLAAAGAALPALAFDPERALWVPGAKTFFLPSQGITPPSITPAMADAIAAPCKNMFVTADWIVKDALRVFEQQLRVTATINRHYNDAILSHEPAMRVRYAR